MVGHRRGSLFPTAVVLCFLRGAAAQYDSCFSGNVSDIGNGRCESVLNVPACGFDGGDCCSCTCSDGPVHTCSDNNSGCLYPDCEPEATSEQTTCDESKVNDGWCDSSNNHVDCAWDGGDCCECTNCFDNTDVSCSEAEDNNAYGIGSIVVPSYGTWGLASSFCQDPTCLFDPAVVGTFPDCSGDWMKIGDGSCTEENNNPLCGWDGGDCCLCSCVGEACETSYFNCLDPTASEEFFNCEEPPPATQPCSSEAQQTWIVEHSAQVRALAAAINCSGGSFEVEWRGNVVVGEPIYVVDGTVLTVTGADTNATIHGGRSAQCFFVVNATLHVTGVTIYGGAGTYGGAVAARGSNLTFSRTRFYDNNAAGNGGAVFLSDDSSMSCVGVAFEVNGAGGKGGAAFLTDGSKADFSADTLFSGNFAQYGDGGGLYVTAGSKASWRGPTEFYTNYAGLAGGALYVASGSDVSWSGSTKYTNNSVSRAAGGAIYVLNGSTVSWTGETEFVENFAPNDGGAVASPTSDSANNPIDSVLSIGSKTTFSGNLCHGNGGALALLGACSVAIAADVSFTRNTAGVAGGAVYVSSTGIGPSFRGTSFVSNVAQIGGAVSVSGSGTTTNINDVDPSNPTTFDLCRFASNLAYASGGAIESAAGQDAVINSIFEGNTALVGGALRLAGTASISNCSFVENSSEEGEGAAISNIGFISQMESNTFNGNSFECPRDTYLDFSVSGEPYETVCDGCQITCNGCSLDSPPLVMACTDVMEHSSSSGGGITLETLSIEPGYWRATKSTTDILDCYNPDACLGGVTGTDGYCGGGYEGPYCAVCSDGYTRQLGFTCTDCSDALRGWILAGGLVVSSVIAALLAISYLISGKREGGASGLVERLGRFIPLQSIKIVVVAWQILTQFTSVANVTYPDGYQRFIDLLDVVNFDLGWVLSATCVVDLDFHDRLLMATIGPIIALLFLTVVYSLAARMNRSAPETLQNVWNKYVSMVLLLTFFVYSSVSSVLFMTFACEELQDTKNYLRADYRIECDSSKHKAFQVYAGFMIAVYTLGIPAFYGVLLFRDREILGRDQADRRDTARVSSTSGVWKSYKPSVFYYEVIECGRRILLAGMIVFIYPNTSAQIAVALLMAFIFVVVAEVLAPYASQWDTWVNRMGHVVVFVTMYVALLLKVDVSDERADSQRVFEVVLIGVHACVVLVVVAEAFFLAGSLRAEQLSSKRSDYTEYPCPGLPSVAASNG